MTKPSRLEHDESKRILIFPSRQGMVFAISYSEGRSRRSYRGFALGVADGAVSPNALVDLTTMDIRRDANAHG